MGACKYEIKKEDTYKISRILTQRDSRRDSVKRKGKDGKIFDLSYMQKVYSAQDATESVDLIARIVTICSRESAHLVPGYHVRSTEFA